MVDNIKTAGGVKLLPFRKNFHEFWRDNGKTVTPFLIAGVILIAGTFVSRTFADLSHIFLMIKVACFVGILSIGQTTVILFRRRLQ